MNALVTPFRQMVDRKLWPLAILLIAALAAVPMLLKKEQTVPAPPAAAVTANTAPAPAATQPIVSLGSAVDREASRKVLGARKDPFKPAKAPKAAATAKATTTTASPVGAPAPAKSGGGTAVIEPPTKVVVPPPVTPVKTYVSYAPKVRFGATDGDELVTRKIRRLTAFPRMSEPTIVYLGLRPDHKTAVFLIGQSTRVISDGECLPAADNCQSLLLKKGQSGFVDVVDAAGQTTAQYRLDMVSVLESRTISADDARDARVAIAAGGRDALRANLSRINGWVFDRITGTVTRPRVSS